VFIQARLIIVYIHHPVKCQFPMLILIRNAGNTGCHSKGIFSWHRHGYVLRNILTDGTHRDHSQNGGIGSFVLSIGKSRLCLKKVAHDEPRRGSCEETDITIMFCRNCFHRDDGYSSSHISIHINNDVIETVSDSID
jgi:hypothetical protein